MYNLKQKIEVRPILKWAGGKSQLLSDILPRIPKAYNRYVEPFIGGAAVFFALQPDAAIISDSNPELVNLYQQVAKNVEDVIALLSRYRNSEEDFYRVRAQNWRGLQPAEAAARMIFLNRTCFNGLYRVNRKGEFNVPYGRYANPKICDEQNLRNASIVLRRATIICRDYLEVLEMVEEGDFVFLDPPYLPVGVWGDFKRYTKEQFYEEDHIRLADAVKRIYQKNAWAILTNSNHPLVHQLYDKFLMTVKSTKRNISCCSKTRTGEDVIVDIIPSVREHYREKRMPTQVECYPSTRYMGSKRKLLSEIWKIASRFDFETVLDLFSGSGIVGYMFKAMGKTVKCNDYMFMAATFAKAMIENNCVTLSEDEARELMVPDGKTDHFVSTTFRGIYFSDDDNKLIDVIRSNIAQLENPYKRAIAMTGLIRACTKKRPRGLFTYVGTRYDDGRKDLQMTMADQFVEGVKVANAAVFNNGKRNKARRGDAMTMSRRDIDVVYIDPPYYTPNSDNEYVRRYHFIEGLARNWEGVEIQMNTQTRKFKSYPTPFSTRNGAADAFDKLFARFRDSVLIVSYSSNSLPTKDEMLAMMARYKEHVEVVPINYRYNFGNRSDGKMNRCEVEEYLFLGY